MKRLPTEQELNKIIRKISKHPQMKQIAFRIWGIMDEKEDYPISLFGITEDFKDIVQDIRGHKRPSLLTNKK
jgi:hypothetical protein